MTATLADSSVWYNEEGAPCEGGIVYFYSNMVSMSQSRLTQAV